MNIIGQTVSHYTIIKKLGEGGMGEVYLAEDANLERNIALKFLPPDLAHDRQSVDRFINEAPAASALDRANICVIHKINVTMKAGCVDDGEF